MNIHRVKVQRELDQLSKFNVASFIHLTNSSF